MMLLPTRMLTLSQVVDRIGRRVYLNIKHHGNLRVRNSLNYVKTWGGQGNCCWKLKAKSGAGPF